MNNDNSKDKYCDDLTMIYSSKNQILVEMVKNAFEIEGIPSLLKSPAGSYLRGMLPINLYYFDFRLYITSDHIRRASEIVETIVPAEEAS